MGASAAPCPPGARLQPSVPVWRHLLHSLVRQACAPIPLGSFEPLTPVSVLSVGALTGTALPRLPAPPSSSWPGTHCGECRASLGSACLQVQQALLPHGPGRLFALYGPHRGRAEEAVTTSPTPGGLLEPALRMSTANTDSFKDDLAVGLLVERCSLRRGAPGSAQALSGRISGCGRPARVALRPRWVGHGPWSLVICMCFFS